VSCVCFAAIHNSTQQDITDEKKAARPLISLIWLVISGEYQRVMPQLSVWHAGCYVDPRSKQ